MFEEGLNCLHVWERLKNFTCLRKAYPGQQEGSLFSTVGEKKRILKKEEDHFINILDLLYFFLQQRIFLKFRGKILWGVWKSVKVSKPEVWDSKDLGDKRRMNFKFCTEAKNHLKYRGHESWVRFVDFEI